MTTTSERDVLVLVEQDHCGFEQLLVRFKEVEPTQHDALFWEFVAALARHEIVEEVVIYPALGRSRRSAGPEAPAPSAGRRVAHALAAWMRPEPVAQGL